jgi:hypothetical protein
LKGTRFTAQGKVAETSKGSEVQGSTQPPAKNTAGLIAEETDEHRIRLQRIE